MILYCWECAPIVGANVKRTDLDDAQMRCDRCGKRNYSVKNEKAGTNNGR